MKRATAAPAPAALAALALGALATLAVGAGCGSARRGEPLAGAFAPDDGAVRRGQLVFARHCDRCHPGGEAGLGPALNNKPLPRFMIKMQVRRGLGSMPSFDERKIADDALDDLADFLVAYRGHGD